MRQLSNRDEIWHVSVDYGSSLARKICPRLVKGVGTGTDLREPSVIPKLFRFSDFHCYGCLYVTT